jgi:cytochrome oxidase Cu insertion factor (SCO1/SenC/PrrC family)
MLALERGAIISLLLVGASLNARDYGPAVGSKIPAFELKDQDGKTHTLASLLGPKGAVILFFRSADW